MPALYGLSGSTIAPLSLTAILRNVSGSCLLYGCLNGIQQVFYRARLALLGPGASHLVSRVQRCNKSALGTISDRDSEVFVFIPDSLHNSSRPTFTLPPPDWEDAMKPQTFEVSSDNTQSGSYHLYEVDDPSLSDEETLMDEERSTDEETVMDEEMAMDEVPGQTVSTPMSCLEGPDEITDVSR